MNPKAFIYQTTERKSEAMASKEELVKEICSVSLVFSNCIHRRRPAQKPAFVDWYMILRIDENASADVVRRRYRQLALQLHPDKNAHPKAEIAFKLVYEAYACLSDNASRKAFDIERQSYLCKECCIRSNNRSNEGLRHKSRSRKALAFLEVQNRLKEENMVIENCLKAARSSIDGGSPIFNPADHRMFPGYPHWRSYVDNSKKVRGHCWKFNLAS